MMTQSNKDQLCDRLAQPPTGVVAIDEDERDPKVFAGSCGGFVVLHESELRGYYDGYRIVMISALILVAIAAPILLISGFLE